MTSEPLRLVATCPVAEVPVWAILQRRLFDMLDEAWRLFESVYTDPDGSLKYSGGHSDRDGADDFYEPFFSWPTLYRLGGSADVLAAAKHHWEGVTRQLTSLGFVADGFEVGYDWFHQGEALLLFYGLCAADPEDETFRERAVRFAELYLPGSPSGNYDAENRMMRAPHNGSRGPRYGLGENWQTYSSRLTGMMPYGLPLRDVSGIREWEDLADDDNARRMGQAMQERLGRGDVAINLAATSLALNAWLFTHDTRFSSWIREYVGAWRARAADNDDTAAPGVIPDNVGLGGEVGEAHGGSWFGGHYGWTWPHGFYSVEAAVIIGAMNELALGAADDALDLARTPLRVVLEHATTERDVAAGSLGRGWAQKLGAAREDEVLLVPYRIEPEGWFDYNPMPLAYPLWLWWLTGDPGDAELLERLRAASGFDGSEPRRFHDKEEQGHEAPWLAYLQGQNPGYPEAALSLALAQVARRVALIRQSPHEPPDGDIHWWQRLNPVVVEVLLQLTTGSPPALYNGGLQFARVLYGDGIAGRPGLPPDVAALVSAVDAAGIALQLVNLSVSHDREVVVQAGAFAEDRIDTVQYDVGGGDYPGSSRDYGIPAVSTVSEEIRTVDANRIVVSLPPLTSVTMRLGITRRAFTPTHVGFRRDDQGES